MGPAVVSVLNLEVAGSRVSYAPTWSALLAALDGGARRAASKWRGFAVTDLVWSTAPRRHGWARHRPAQPRRPSRSGRRCRRPPLLSGAHRRPPSSAERPATRCRYRAMWRGLRAGVPELFCLDGATVESCPVVRTWPGLTSISPSRRGRRSSVVRKRPTWPRSGGYRGGWSGSPMRTGRPGSRAPPNWRPVTGRLQAGAGRWWPRPDRTMTCLRDDAAAHFADAETTATTISMRLSGGRGRAAGSYEAFPDGDGHGVAAIA